MHRLRRLITDRNGRSFAPPLNRSGWAAKKRIHHWIDEGALMNSTIRVESGLAKVAVVAAAALLIAPSAALAATPQEHVHRMSHHVMPFEITKTIHVFKMTVSGGVKRVLVRDPKESDQVALIRQHLQYEAGKFKRGDYSDPAKLHGADMPGLAELQVNPSAVEVSYSELSSGGQISFKTDDLRLLTAIQGAIFYLFQFAFKMTF
jgi:hypothetical protein